MNKDEILKKIEETMLTKELTEAKTILLESFENNIKGRAISKVYLFLSALQLIGRHSKIYRSNITKIFDCKQNELKTEVEKLPVEKAGSVSAFLSIMQSTTNVTNCDDNEMLYYDNWFKDKKYEFSIHIDQNVLAQEIIDNVF